MTSEKCLSVDGVWSVETDRTVSHDGTDSKHPVCNTRIKFVNSHRDIFKMVYSAKYPRSEIFSFPLFNVSSELLTVYHEVYWITIHRTSTEANSEKSSKSKTFNSLILEILEDKLNSTVNVSQRI